MRVVVVISVILVTSLVKADGLWNELENILEDYENLVNETGSYPTRQQQLFEFFSFFLHFLW